MNDQPQGTSPTSTTTSNDPVGGGGAAPAGAAPGAPATAAFYESFADKTLAALPAVQKFKSPEDLAASYIALEKRFGVDPARRIDLPTDPNDTEAMRAVYAKLGLPEKPDGYGLALPEGATDADKALIGKFTEAAHKMGMPAPFAKEVTAFWLAQAQEAQAAQAAAWSERTAKGNADLKAEFGGAFEQKNREIDLFLDRYADPELKEALKGENRGGYPGLTKMIAKLIDKMAEPDIAGGRSGDAGGHGGERALTPVQARAAVTALQADPVKGKALFDRSHPMHKEVVAERSKLLAMAEGRAA